MQVYNIRMLQKIKYEISEIQSNKYFNYFYYKLDARGKGRIGSS